MMYTHIKMGEYGDWLKTSEFDIYKRQILTSKHYSAHNVYITNKNNIFIMVVDPWNRW